MHLICCMEAKVQKILICNCKGTLAIDPDRLARAFDSEALNRLKMCEDCRVIAMMEDDQQPFQHGTVPVPRTTDDYLQEREKLRAQAGADIKSNGLDISDEN